MKKSKLFLLLGVFCLVCFGAGYGAEADFTDIFGHHSIIAGDSDKEDSIKYGSLVCISKNDELIECDHNVLYATGKNAIRTALGDDGTGGPYDYINLCNATAGCTEPDEAKTETYNEYDNCGMAEAQGTYGSMNDGNWSVWHTFTSTCADTVEINATRLTDSTTDLAGNSFTKVSLENGDKLTVNWTVWVE